MNALLRSYHENRKELDRLKASKEREQEEAKKETYRLKWDVYGPKIKALETERDEKVSLIESVQASRDNEYDLKFKKCSGEVDKVKRIFDLIGLHREPLFNTEFVVFEYSREDINGRYLSEAIKVNIEPLEVLCSDEGKYVAVYLLVNKKKPVNKYSLVVMGRSMFKEIISKENIVSHGSVYGMSVNFDTYPDFAISMMEGEDRDELLKRWESKKVARIIKVQDGAIGRWMMRIDEIAVEYVEAVELYGQLEWRLAYLESRLEYYRDGVSGGRGLDEYKAIEEEIKVLRTPLKDLPLLIGQITQEYPLWVLSGLLKGNNI